MHTRVYHLRPPTPTPSHTCADSGVGAGIDSYYEYCLKSYVLLGEETYRKRFEKVRLYVFMNAQLRPQQT